MHFEHLHVCPPWLGPWLLAAWRKRVQDPDAILAPHVRPGMIVVEPGPGMGFFSLALGRLVRPSGRVVCVDLQPAMLDALERRSRRAGLERTIELRRCAADDLGVADLAGRADFVLVFYMVHEVPDRARFLAQLFAVLRPGGRLLLAEPYGHVTAAAFAETETAAFRAGFVVVARPSIRWSRAVLLEKLERSSSRA